MYHEADHGDNDHILATADGGLVIFAQPAAFADPCEGSFDTPAHRLHLKGLLSRRRMNDGQRHAKPRADVENTRALVAGVGPDLGKPPLPPAELPDQWDRAVAVLDVGRLDEHHQQQPERVDGYLPLAPGDMLRRVVAARPPFSVVWTVWLSMMTALGPT